MPNLNSWIEAQLKRGHSREAIKKQLLKRGYSRKAVAEVDKISVIKAFQKTSNQKPSYSTVILLLATALLIAIAIFSYNSYQRVEEQGTIGKTAEQEIITAQKEKILMQKFVEENMMPDYQPSLLELSELPLMSNPDNAKSGNAYGAEWNHSWRNMSITFSALIQYNSGNKDISYYGVSVEMPNVLNSINESNVYPIHGIFFKNEKIKWSCEKLRNITACKNVIINEDKTKRVDMLREFQINLILLSRYNFPITSESYGSNQ